MLPLSPDWLAQSLDDLRRERDPAWPQRGGANALQSPGLAPVGDRGDIHVEQFSCRLCRIAPIPPLSGGRAFWPLWASSRDVIGIADPLDFADRQRTSHAGSLPLLVEQGCNLRIGMCRSQLPHALDRLW